ncbi:MAG: putative CRISPR-associated protein [Candidatus Sumerlaeaceae bacterium]|nr:putative CRISPR-associated protein [Candidatus Sumerlaeaceae bacterium]
MNRWLSTADMEAASAETNTLRRINLSQDDKLILMHSSTPEGRFCAECLADLYKNSTRDVIVKEVSELGYAADKFSSALKKLIDITVNTVTEAAKEGATVIIAATGGFKAEIAFLNLLGALCGIEVVYLHELHRNVVRLPQLPLSWDANFVAQNLEFFQWIDEEPRRANEVESWLNREPRLRFLVETTPDGYCYLSPAGYLLYKAGSQQIKSTQPQTCWPGAVPDPPDKKNRVSTVPHHRPKGWEEFVKWLCLIDCVKSVHYDKDAISGPRVRVHPNEDGVILLRFEKGKEILPLRVETTARGTAQCELVKSYLEKRLS